MIQLLYSEKCALSVQCVDMIHKSKLYQINLLCLENMSDSNIDAVIYKHNINFVPTIIFDNKKIYEATQCFNVVWRLSNIFNAKKFKSPTNLVDPITLDKVIQPMMLSCYHVYNITSVRELINNGYTNCPLCKADIFTTIQKPMNAEQIRIFCEDIGCKS